MRAVRHVFGGGRHDGRVVVGVVVGEGDLAVDVRTGTAVRECAREGLGVGLAHAHVDTVHRAGEGVMVRLQARVDDLDDLTVALLGGLVRAGHRQGRGIGEDGCAASLGGGLHRLVGALNERRLDALDLLNRGEGRCGGLDGEAVERVGVVAHGGDLRAGDDPLDGGGDTCPHRVVCALRGRAEGAHSDGAVLELNDDRCRGVAGRGRGRARGCGAGSWPHSPAGRERGRGGKGGRGEGEREGERERRRWSMGHLGLTSLTTMEYKPGAGGAITIMSTLSHLCSMPVEKPSVDAPPPDSRLTLIPALTARSRRKRPGRPDAETPRGRPGGRPLGVSHQHSASTPG